MNNNAPFTRMLVTEKFGLRLRNAVVEFYSEMLTDLANLLPKDLDRIISNLHKYHLNVTNATHRIRLNATKYRILHAI